MLDALSPQQFDEWVAFRRIEPDPADRLRVILTTGLLALCQSWGVEITPKDLDPMLEEQEQEVTPEQAAAMMRLAYSR